MYKTKGELNAVGLPKGLDTQIAEMMRDHPNGLRLAEFSHRFWQSHSDMELQVRAAGFSSLEESLGYVSCIYLKNVMGEMYVLPSVPKVLSSMAQLSISDCLSATDFYTVQESVVSSRPCFPPKVLQNFQKIAEKYPQGVIATHFPIVYEAVTGTPFSMPALGYNSLQSLIRDVPHIFRRKELVKVTNNWLVVPTGSNPDKIEDKNEGVFKVIWNMRKLLKMNPDGIYIRELQETYWLNFLMVLNNLKFGYNSLESFINSIAAEVPLEIILDHRSEKVVKYVETQVQSTLQFLPKAVLEHPSDIVMPGTLIPTAGLPRDLDYTKYFAAYVSQVEDPGHFYTQLCGPDYGDKLLTMLDKIQSFYQSCEGVRYVMQASHIQPDAACVALYPYDMCWYRAKIVSILSMEHVEVMYVDYGGKKKIPITSLRYLKKEFSELPAQAFPSTLACLRPANNLVNWDMRATRMMLNLVKCTQIMAKIDSISKSGNTLL